MFKHKMLITFTIILALSCSPINTYPSGAPETVCETLLPFHGGGIAPMSTNPPFRIDSTASIVGQGQTVRVDILGIPPELGFGGYMIQARNQNPPYQPIGEFSESSGNSIKLMNCGNGVRNSATHTSSNLKNGVSIEWQAPADFNGYVVFNTTVAQGYDKFWVGIESAPVQIVKREAAPPPVVGISSTRPPLTTTQTVYRPEPEVVAVENDPFYEGCGQTKTCFGFPDGCAESKSCQAVSAIKVRGDIYEFEIQSGYKNPAYVALGLSTDDKMGDDLVTECIPQGDKVVMFSSWTSPSPNYGVTRTGVSQNSAKLLQSSIKDGVIYCKVQRDSVFYVQGRKFDLVNDKYHLLVASGSSVKENGAGYHDIGRIPSANPISLAVVQNLAASSTLLLRLHGAFMILAWIGTTSVGILLARYFKQTWVGSQICGKDQWFAWHRICMVTTWSLTVAAFVIIFVQIGGWSAENNPHAILGVVTTAICFFQPIGALFRPAPNSSSRPIFNWLHWLGGNAAHILSIVTIFFAVKLTKAELPEWMDWILVAFVAFHVIVHLILSIAGCSSDRQASQRVNSFPMSDMAGGRNNMKLDRKMDAPYAGFRKGLLGAYIVIVILFVAALIVVVVLAPIEENFNTFKAKLMD